MISLFGKKLFYLTLTEIEMLLREVYREITYTENNKVFFKTLYDITPVSGLDDIKKKYTERKTEVKEQEPFGVYRKIILIIL